MTVFPISSSKPKFFEVKIPQNSLKKWTILAKSQELSLEKFFQLEQLDINFTQGASTEITSTVDLENATKITLASAPKQRALEVDFSKNLDFSRENRGRGDEKFDGSVAVEYVDSEILEEKQRNLMTMPVRYEKKMAEQTMDGEGL